MPELGELMRRHNLIARGWRKRTKAYLSPSASHSDKLMAEQMRSILLGDEYQANAVEVSQRTDALSFSGGVTESESWSFSSNSTLLVVCLVVLCGGIVVGKQKGFAFKYSAVYG